LSFIGISLQGKVGLLRYIFCAYDYRLNVNRFAGLFAEDYEEIRARIEE